MGGPEVGVQELDPIAQNIMGDFDIAAAFEGGLNSVITDEELDLNDKVARVKTIITEADSDEYRSFVDFTRLAAQVRMCCDHDEAFQAAVGNDETVSNFVEDNTPKEDDVVTSTTSEALPPLSLFANRTKGAKGTDHQPKKTTASFFNAPAKKKAVAPEPADSSIPTPQLQAVAALEQAKPEVPTESHSTKNKKQHKKVTTSTAQIADHKRAAKIQASKKVVASNAMRKPSDRKNDQANTKKSVANKEVQKPKTPIETTTNETPSTSSMDTLSPAVFTASVVVGEQTHSGPEADTDVPALYDEQELIEPYPTASSDEAPHENTGPETHSDADQQPDDSDEEQAQEMSVVEPVNSNKKSATDSEAGLEKTPDFRTFITDHIEQLGSNIEDTVAVVSESLHELAHEDISARKMLKILDPIVPESEHKAHQDFYLKVHEYFELYGHNLASELALALQEILTGKHHEHNGITVQSSHRHSATPTQALGECALACCQAQQNPTLAYSSSPQFTQ